MLQTHNKCASQNQVVAQQVVARSNTRLLGKRTSQAIFRWGAGCQKGSRRSCSPAGAAREPGHAAAPAEGRVHLQTGRCCRARFAVTLPVLTLAVTGGATQLLLFEVCKQSNPVSSRENRGRARDSKMLVCPTLASAATPGSATAYALAVGHIDAV